MLTYHLKEYDTADIYTDIPYFQATTYLQFVFQVWESNRK